MEGIALRDVPGNHIAVPVQIADDDQRGLRTVRGAQLLKQLFADLFKRVEIDDGHACAVPGHTRTVLCCNENDVI